MSTNAQIEVIDGGNKLDLFAQLIDIGRVPERPGFWLKVQRPRLGGILISYDIYVNINGIVAEDGSGDNWIISGYVQLDYVEKHPWLKEKIDHLGHSFRGYYSTRRRTGYITAPER